MAVTADNTRKTVAIVFDGVTGKTFNVRAVNAAAGDVHSSGPHKLELNDAGEGQFVISYPSDFSGTSEVEITGSDGSRTDGLVDVA